MGNVQAGYEERYLAYLDIIGYRDMVKEAVDTSAQMRAISRLRESVDETLDQHPSLCRAQTRIFSDCVVIHAPADDAGCYATVRWTMHVAGRLAYHGLWVRGNITRGRHFDDGTVLFSPALIEAYTVERDEAFYPRVLIDAAVAEDCYAMADEATRERIIPGIWTDQDGRLFLNYLAVAADGTQLLELLRRHQSNIRCRLRKHKAEPRKLAKYGWLRTYHNRFCREDLSARERYLIGDASDEVPLSP